MTFNFRLEPYTGPSSRYTCPGCRHKRKTFKRYVDAQGNYLSPEAGKCDREVNCGYHLTPREWFRLHPQGNQQCNTVMAPQQRVVKKPVVHQPSFIADAYVAASRRAYEANNFVCYLRTRFGHEAADALLKQYYVGTSKHWPGATIFWQTDAQGRTRAGKIMLYDAHTGKRSKTHHPTWVHCMKHEDKPLFPDYRLQQCFFGEHLLHTERAKPVAIVESEKTALIATLYLPEYIWLACGSKQGMTEEKCKALHGRSVTLYPDLGCYDDWKALLPRFTDARISDLLERTATEAARSEGLDIADYLLLLDHRESTPAATAGQGERETEGERAEPHQPFTGRSGKYYMPLTTHPSSLTPDYHMYHTEGAYRYKLYPPVTVTAAEAWKDREREMVLW